MASLVNYGNDPAHPEKISAFVRNPTTGLIEYPAFKAFKKDEEVVFSGQMNGQNLLAYHGITIDNNHWDCYGIQVTFTGNKDDSMASKRKNFFAKFFLYDSSQIDVMYNNLLIFLF